MVVSPLENEIKCELEYFLDFYSIQVDPVFGHEIPQGIFNGVKMGF